MISNLKVIKLENDCVTLHFVCWVIVKRYPDAKELTTICLEIRLFTKMLRIHLFSIFTIKTLRALAVLAPLGLLLVMTLTNVLQLVHT